jgi:cell envelope opacity-associated protein A
MLRAANPFRAGVIAMASAAVALTAGYQLSAQISRSLQSTVLSAPETMVRPALAPVALAEPAVDPIEELVLDVQSGDTLDSLFRATNLSLVDLAEILQLDVARKYLRVLRPGDVLHVRHDGGSVLELGRELDIRSKAASRPTWLNSRWSTGW